MNEFEKTVEVPLEVIYEELLAAEPKLVTNFVPDASGERKQAFLDSDDRTPGHTYGRLDAVDVPALLAEIGRTGKLLLEHPALNPKFAAAYRQFVHTYEQKAALLEAARSFNHADDPVERSRNAQEFMALNKEFYGEPSEVTYRSLLQEKVADIEAKQLDPVASRIKDELLELLDIPDSADPVERFKPAPETMEWMNSVVITLYSSMLSRVPDQPTFSPTEIKTVFESIILNEFGEAADGWQVDVEPAKSLTVKSAEKRVVIPEDRDDMDQETLKKMVVHEIGVHMLRSVMGGETDLPLLRNGLDGYLDTEEGIGKVMEQALDGIYVEAGIDHYITVGLSYLDNKDFRDTFEAKWRLQLLSDLEEGQEAGAEAIEKAKNIAYGATMRILRGTDELPWFKDLSYYNGTAEMWQYLESIRGDDIKFMFVLLGKANPARNSHQRLQYETASH